MDSNVHDAEYETGEHRGSDTIRNCNRNKSSPTKKSINAWVKNKDSEDRRKEQRNHQNQRKNAYKNNLSYDGDEESKDERNSGDIVQRFEGDEIDANNQIYLKKL